MNTDPKDSLPLGESCNPIEVPQGILGGPFGFATSQSDQTANDTGKQQS